MAFHLGFITSFEVPAWSLARTDRLNGGNWWNGDFFVDLAKRLESSGIEFMFFPDTLGVSRAVGGRLDTDLKNAVMSPAQDPLPLMAKIAALTEKIGLIATASTTFTSPYSLARVFSTLDSLSGGRIGWNMVTTAHETSALAYGVDALPSHAERYEMADEFVELVKILWDSWDADAIVADVEKNMYVDPAKVRDVDFKGKYFKARGPLNTVRGPQGAPVLAQAGSSGPGRDFAAKHADLVFTSSQTGIAAMKEFRDDLRARAAKFGRNPDDIKVVYSAFVDFAPEGETSKTWAPPPPTRWQQEYAIGARSTSSNIDLTKYPIDGPVPAELETEGFKGLWEEFKTLGNQGMTLGEAASALWSGKGLNLFGSADEIADKMIAAMEEVGGDGMMIAAQKLMSKDYIDNVTNKLLPALKARGAIKDYGPGLLRDRLTAF